MAERSVLVSKTQYLAHKVLEISGASVVSLGAKLSTMRLSKQTMNGCTPVERYYMEHCCLLTNRKEEDNYLDLRKPQPDDNPKRINPMTDNKEICP